jgi:hypothetical protein
MWRKMWFNNSKYNKSLLKKKENDALQSDLGAIVRNL